MTPVQAPEARPMAPYDRPDGAAVAPTIAMVTTRDTDADPTLSGRHRTVRFVREAVGRCGTVSEHRLHNLFECRSVPVLVGAAFRFLWGLLRGRPLPLQCLLFSVPAERRRLVGELRETRPRVLYLDGIRPCLLLNDLAGDLDGVRVVVDMDDLMSRRMALIRERRLPLSLGYLRASVPGPLRAVAESAPVARLVTGYEMWALRRVERAALERADAVVLLSAADAADLAGRTRDPALAARVHVVPPPREAVREAVPVKPPIRFVLIGSDRQVQNRLSIDHLVDLWRRVRPAAELHVFGRQQRPPIPVPGVVWRGFVEKVDDVYDAHSVLLYPAFLGGGVKSKVIEAFSYGAPVVGNRTTFEGLALTDYPLCLEAEAIEALVADPAAHLDALREGGRTGQAFLCAALNLDRYRAGWREVIAPAAPAPPPAGAPRPARKGALRFGTEGGTARSPR